MRTILITTAVALFAGPAAAQDGATIATEQSDEYGTYLTDGEARAVYLFTTDKPEGGGDAQITCTSEECLNAWPLVTTTGEPQAEGEAQADMLGTMDYEGQTVVTYNDWPLYYFVRDEGADAPQGQDVESFGGEWYLVQPSGEAVGH